VSAANLVEIENQNSSRPNGAISVAWSLEMGSWTWLKKNPMQLLDLFRQFTLHHASWRGLEAGARPHTTERHDA